MTQVDMNACAADELTQVEAQLPAVLRAAERVFVPALVREDQRRWLAYREAHCAAIASTYEGGSIQPLIISECETELTVVRIKGLRVDIAAEFR